MKEVYGIYTQYQKRHPTARLIPEISVSELRKLALQTLPFERILLDLLDNARLLKRFQIVNGCKPARIIRALEGDHVGTIVYAG